MLSAGLRVGNQSTSVLLVKNKCRCWASAVRSSCQNLFLEKGHPVWGPGEGCSVTPCAEPWLLLRHPTLGCQQTPWQSLLCLPAKKFYSDFKRLSSPARAWVIGFCKVHSVQGLFWAQKSNCVVYDFHITIPVSSHAAAWSQLTDKLLWTTSWATVLKNVWIYPHILTEVSLGVKVVLRKCGNYHNKVMKILRQPNNDTQLNQLLPFHALKCSRSIWTQSPASLTLGSQLGLETWQVSHFEKLIKGHSRVIKAQKRWEGREHTSDSLKWRNQ